MNLVVTQTNKFLRFLGKTKWSKIILFFACLNFMMPSNLLSIIRCYLVFPGIMWYHLVSTSIGWYRYQKVGVGQWWEIRKDESMLDQHVCRFRSYMPLNMKSLDIFFLFLQSIQ